MLSLYFTHFWIEVLMSRYSIRNTSNQGRGEVLKIVVIRLGLAILLIRFEIPDVDIEVPLNQ